MNDTLDITYRDGVKNELYHFAANTASNQVLLIMPAMGVRASYYKPFAIALSQEGFRVICADFRGQGQSSIRPSRKVDYGYEFYVQDLDEIVNLIKQKFSGCQLTIIGHSLGGQIGALYKSRYPKKLDQLILIAACSVYHKGWKGGGQVQVRLAATLFYPISYLVGYFPGNVIGFGGKEARTTIRDWSLNGRTGLYRPLDADFDYEQALCQTKVKLLAISMETDSFAPKAAVVNLYQKFDKQSEIQHLHLSKAEAPLNHFNWVKKIEPILGKITAWLKQV